MKKQLLSVIVALILSALAFPGCSESLSPSPSPTTAEEALLDQQIQDFLNSKGEFSDEALQNKMFTDVEPMKFGRFPYSDTGIVVWFFDDIRKDGSDWLIVGLDGKDGKRFVTVFEVQNRANGGVFGNLLVGKDTFTKVRADRISQKFDGECMRLESGEEIYGFFSGIANQPLGIRLGTAALNPPVKVDQERQNSFDDYNNRVGLANEVFMEAADNGNTSFSELHPETIKEGTKLVRIEKLSDIGKITSNEIPIVSGVTLMEYIDSSN